MTNTIDNDSHDSFATRYGYVKGRCNAHTRNPNGKLCGHKPLKGKRRCSRHGGRGNHGGWHTGKRKCLEGVPYFAKEPIDNAN